MARSWGFKSDAFDPFPPSQEDPIAAEFALILSFGNKAYVANSRNRILPLLAFFFGEVPVVKLPTAFLPVEGVLKPPPMSSLLTG